MEDQHPVAQSLRIFKHEGDAEPSEMRALRGVQDEGTVTDVHPLRHLLLRLLG